MLQVVNCYVVTNECCARLDVAKWLCCHTCILCKIRCCKLKLVVLSHLYAVQDYMLQVVQGHVVTLECFARSDVASCRRRSDLHIDLLYLRLCCHPGLSIKPITV